MLSLQLDQGRARQANIGVLDPLSTQELAVGRERPREVRGELDQTRWCSLNTQGVMGFKDIIPCVIAESSFKDL